MARERDRFRLTKTGRGPCSRAWRRHAVTLAILSLLLQAVLLSPSIGVDRTESAQGVPGWVMASLCSSHDAASIDPASGPEKQDPKTAAVICPICLGLCYVVAYLPPDHAGLKLPGKRRGVIAVQLTEPAPPAVFRIATWARGPPPLA